MRERRRKVGAVHSGYMACNDGWMDVNMGSGSAVYRFAFGVFFFQCALSCALPVA